MSWVKVKNLITGQVLTVPNKSGIDICRDNSLFVIVEEPKPEVKPKTSKPKEEKKNVEEIRLDEEDDNSPSGQDNKKVGV